MAIRFSFKDALEGMAHVAAGTLAGKIQGIQMQQEQQQRAMQTAQMLQEQQSRKNQEQLGYLNLIGKGEFQSVQSPPITNPNALPGIPIQEPAIGASSPLPTTPTGPIYHTPIGDIQQAQISDDDKRDIEKSSTQIRNILAKADPNDANTKLTAQAFNNINLSPTNPEELANTKSALYHLALAGTNYREPASKIAADKLANQSFNKRWDTLSQSTNPREGAREVIALLDDYDEYKAQGARLPANIEAHRSEIDTIKKLLDKEDYKGADTAFKIFQGGLSQVDDMKPGERNRAFDSFFKLLDRRPVQDLNNPAIIKQLAKSVGLNSIAGLSNNELLSFYRGRAEKEYEDLEKLLPRFEKLPPSEQVRIVEGLNRYGKIAGKPLLDPSSFGKLSPEAKAKLDAIRVKTEQTKKAIEFTTAKIKELPQIIEERAARIRNLNERTHKLKLDTKNKRVSKADLTIYDKKVKDAMFDLQNAKDKWSLYKGSKKYTEQLNSYEQALNKARQARNAADAASKQSIQSTRPAQSKSSSISATKPDLSGLTVSQLLSLQAKRAKELGIK